MNQKAIRSEQRGTAVSIEAVILVPALVMFLGLVVFLGQIALLEQSVSAAANQAARSASLERSADAARQASSSAAAASLADSQVTCQKHQIRTDTTALAAASQPGVVTVEVTCQAEVAVRLPGFPAHRRITATGSSPVDAHRSQG